MEPRVIQSNNKWNFAIGTTSRVPDSGGLHYLIIDYDTQKLNISWITQDFKNAILQRTPHGWHIYTDAKMTFDELCSILPRIGADPVWVKIGKERGYFFLADKSCIVFPWPVEHMVIHRGKEKAQHTKAS